MNYAKELWAITDLGYSFTIMYRSGHENLAADALSRVMSDQEEMRSVQLQFLTCAPLPDWLGQLREENTTNTWIIDRHNSVIIENCEKGFSVREGLLLFDNRFCIRPKSTSRTVILEEYHNSKTGGHAGYFRSRLGRDQP